MLLIFDREKTKILKQSGLSIHSKVYGNEKTIDYNIPYMSQNNYIVSYTFNIPYESHLGKAYFNYSIPYYLNYRAKTTSIRYNIAYNDVRSSIRSYTFLIPYEVKNESFLNSFIIYNIPFNITAGTEKVKLEYKIPYIHENYGGIEVFYKFNMRYLDSAPMDMHYIYNIPYENNLLRDGNRAYRWEIPYLHSVSTTSRDVIKEFEDDNGELKQEVVTPKLELQGNKIIIPIMLDNVLIEKETDLEKDFNLSITYPPVFHNYIFNTSSNPRNTSTVKTDLSGKVKLIFNDEAYYRNKFGEGLKSYRFADLEIYDNSLLSIDDPSKIPGISIAILSKNGENKTIEYIDGHPYVDINVYGGFSEFANANLRLRDTRDETINNSFTKQVTTSSVKYRIKIKSTISCCFDKEILFSRSSSYSGCRLPREVDNIKVVSNKSIETLKIKSTIDSFNRIVADKYNVDSDLDPIGLRYDQPERAISYIELNNRINPNVDVSADLKGKRIHEFILK